MSPSSNNLAAGLYFGRDSVSCVLLRTDAGERTVVSSSTINLPLPLFKGAPQEQTTRALVDALVARWGSERDSAGTTVWFVLEP